MAATPSVRIVKTMPFKAGTRSWSNRHHFSGGTPADLTHWQTLFDAIVAAEKACLLTDHTITSALGYAAGSDVPVASKTYSEAGTHTLVGAEAPGECAALVRFTTNARTSKNHPVYLFTYLHGADIVTNLGDADTLVAGYVTAIEGYIDGWMTGFSDGTITVVRSGPNGDDATGYQVEEFVTHRDFPYSSSV